MILLSFSKVGKYQCMTFLIVFWQMLNSMSTRAQVVIKSKDKSIIFHHFSDGHPEILGEYVLGLCARFKHWESLGDSIDRIEIENLEGDINDLPDIELREFLMQHETIEKHINPPVGKDKHVQYKYVIDLDSHKFKFYERKDNDFKMFLSEYLISIRIYDYDKILYG